MGHSANPFSLRRKQLIVLRCCSEKTHGAEKARIQEKGVAICAQAMICFVETIEKVSLGSPCQPRLRAIPFKLLMMNVTFKAVQRNKDLFGIDNESYKTNKLM